MMFTDLPNLEDTQSGKDLIRIGEARGEARSEARGMVRAILIFLEAKHGWISKSLRARIERLQPEQAQCLMAHLPHCESLSDVKTWLEKIPKS